MLVRSMGQTLISPVVRQIFKNSNRAHFPTQRLVFSTEASSGGPAWATKDQLSRVELGLTEKLAGVEIRLSEKIAKTSTELSEKITKEVSGVEIRLSEKIAKTSTELTEKLAGVEIRLSEKIAKGNSDLLVAIERQNTHQEKFKRRVYVMIVGLFTSGVAYASRDRLLLAASSFNTKS